MAGAAGLHENRRTPGRVTAFVRQSSEHPRNGRLPVRIGASLKDVRRPVGELRIDVVREPLLLRRIDLRQHGRIGFNAIEQHLRPRDATRHQFDGGGADGGAMTAPAGQLNPSGSDPPQNRVSYRSRAEWRTDLSLDK